MVGWRGLAERHRAPGTRPRTASDARSLPGLARGSIRSLPAARSAGGPGSGFQTRKFQGHLTTPGLLELVSRGSRLQPGGGTEDARAPGPTPVTREVPPTSGPRPLGAEPPRATPRPGSQVPEQWTAELELREVRFLATSQILSNFQKEQLGSPQRLSVLCRVLDGLPGAPQDEAGLTRKFET